MSSLALTQHKASQEWKKEYDCTLSNGYDFMYKNHIFLNIACNYQYQ